MASDISMGSDVRLFVRRRGGRYNRTEATARVCPARQQYAAFGRRLLRAGRARAARGHTPTVRRSMPTGEAAETRPDENAAAYSEFVGRLRQAGYAGVSPETAVVGFHPSTGTEITRRALANGVCATVNHGSAFVFSEVAQIPGLLKVWQSSLNTI